MHSLFFQLFVLNCPVLSRNLEKTRASYFLSVSKSTKLDALTLERPPIETRCYEALVKPGALIRIKAPRQMGKSSLMLRILNHGIEQGYQTASLNFQLVDRNSLSNLGQFLQRFCNSVANELNLEDKLADY